MKKAFGLAKVHGNHKGLDAAIVKATNYDHILPKEKHIRTIFQSLSPSKPRSEVFYCVHGLARRLSQTNNWAKYSQKLDTQELLGQLPPLQNLLFRLLDCKPEGAAAYNRLIQYALSVVAGESIKLYVATTVKVVELLDKFFEMHRNEAACALEIYQKSGSQAERLSEFFETCRGLDFGRGQKFINIKMPPASFMSTMEEYINDAPSTLMLESSVKADDKGATANESAAPVGDLLTEVNQEGGVDEKSDPSQEKNEAIAPTQAADLMGLYDLLTGASEFDENSLALAIVPTENSASSSNDENGASPITGWEVALFTEPESSNESVVAESTEVDGLDTLNLDNLYDNAIAGTQQNGAYQMGQVVPYPYDFGASNIAVEPSTIQNAYYAPSNMTSPIPAQMVGMPYQDYHMMYQQQTQEPFIMNKKSTNPFDEPNMLPPGMPSHPTQST